MEQGKITFDFSANPFDEPHSPDDERYQTMVAVTRHGYQLGYDTVWFAEHNFTDYYILPSPLLAYAHLAGQCPGLGLGTCVIAVPWHDPVRLASEIGMLTLLTDAPLHLAVGRGNTLQEYQGYGRDMSTSLVVFKEAMDIVRLALKGEPFTYRGEELSVEPAIQIRPRPKPDLVTFYAACSHPNSAEKVARQDLGMLGSSWHTFDALKMMTELYDRTAAACGTDPNRDKVVWVQTLIADSDDEAIELGERYIRQFYQLVCRHYRLKKDWLAEQKDYAEAGSYFADLVMSLAFTDALTEHLTRQFVGSPKTVAERVQKYVDAGYNRMIVQPDMHSVPRQLQAQTLTRFAREVAPHFATNLSERRRAVS